MPEPLRFNQGCGDEPGRDRPSGGPTAAASDCKSVAVGKDRQWTDARRK